MSSELSAEAMFNQMGFQKTRDDELCIEYAFMGISMFTKYRFDKRTKRAYRAERDRSDNNAEEKAVNQQLIELGWSE